VRLDRDLSKQVFDAVTEEQVEALFREIDKAVGGLRWRPLGGIDNNVHAVEVASDPAAAIVERVTNSIDALLDLHSILRDETAPSPRAAAEAWLGVPEAGLSELNPVDRQSLANSIRVTSYESSIQARPTLVIQDHGTGQHPDAFSDTLLSLLASNKKTKTHQMGVYNAGGAATYAFCKYSVIISRRDPRLLGGATDEIGCTLIRYNPLDPERFKSGTYEYCVGPDGAILRLNLESGVLPDMPAGTYVKHVAYELASYQRAAHEPKQSLHHLFHAALPDPPLPFWIEEQRTERFAGVRSSGERRVVAGLLARLRREGTAAHYDERDIALEPEHGHVALRYFVLEEGQEPDAFTTYSQAVTLLLNGQRQGMKDRAWIKRNTNLSYLWRRLVVLIDCNGLTNAAKREVFSSTRESNKESPLSRTILDRVRTELAEDEELLALDEQARQRTLANATRSTSERIRRQLAGQIAAFLQGPGAGQRGGGAAAPPRSRPPRPPRDRDDAGMLAMPDTLKILDDPVRIAAGRTAPLRIHINAKNGFIPDHGDALKIVVGPDLAPWVKVRSVGRLLGGEVRLTLEAHGDAPRITADLRALLVETDLGLALDAASTIEVVEPAPRTRPSEKSGGGPLIDIEWIDHAGWSEQDPPWSGQTVGECLLERDSSALELIARAEFRLNKAFEPFESVMTAKRLSANLVEQFQDAYAFPLCWAMFTETVDRERRERQADEGGEPVNIPAEYVDAERQRMARTVLLAMEPELAAAVEADD
jgi:hypothetical protein